MTEFITKSLGELTSIMTKGIAPKYVEEESNSTIVVLNQKCNRDFSISLEQSRLNDCNKKAVSPERMLHKYDVLINSTGTGTAGRVAQLFNIPEPMTIDGHMILIRPTDEIDPIYYGYAVKAHQAEIEMLAEGSTGQTEINRKRLSSEIMISFPVNIESQKQIGELLYQIDQKIWTNTAINDNLFAQARAIAKQWISESTGDYEMLSLSDTASINPDTYTPKEEWEYVNYLDTSSITNDYIAEIQCINTSFEKLPSRARRKLAPNDIVFSTVRPNQRHFGIISKPCPICLVQPVLQ